MDNKINNLAAQRLLILSEMELYGFFCCAFQFIEFTLYYNECN